jgi:hypothetical protein
MNGLHQKSETAYEPEQSVFIGEHSWFILPLSGRLSYCGWPVLGGAANRSACRPATSPSRAPPSQEVNIRRGVSVWNPLLVPIATAITWRLGAT